MRLGHCGGLEAAAGRGPWGHGAERIRARLPSHNAIEIVLRLPSAVDRCPENVNRGTGFRVGLGPDELGVSNPWRNLKSMSSSSKETSASQQIDAIIKESGGWRGEKLSQLRRVIKKGDPAVVEEVKWKKPSKPEGVPVWSHDGILCVGETLKNAVRLTFPKGGQMKDPKKLFNTRLDGNTVRAIDFHEADAVDEAALQVLILEAVELNTSKVSKR